MSEQPFCDFGGNIRIKVPQGTLKSFAIFILRANTLEAVVDFTFRLWNIKHIGI
jgi:hypothetical protein